MVPISKSHQAQLIELISNLGQVMASKKIGLAIHTITKASFGQNVRRSTAAWIENWLDKNACHNRTTCKERT